MKFRIALTGLGLLLPVVASLPARCDPAPLQESAPAVMSALQDVISRQIAAFHAGDFAKAYTFAATEIQRKYSPAIFEQMVKIGYPILTCSTATEFGPALDDGRTGVVYVHVVGAQGRQLYVYSLRREQAGWRITSVSLREEAKPEDAPDQSHRVPPFSA